MLSRMTAGVEATTPFPWVSVKRVADASRDRADRAIDPLLSFRPKREWSILVTALFRRDGIARRSRHACPVAEQYSATILSLPMFPDMEERQLEYVAGLLSDYMECL